MSFNTFGKAGKFLELNFGPGIFWGFSWEVQGYYCVLVFALIRSSLSLEILSSPPPPPPSPGMLLDKNESISFHWELKSLFVHSVQVLRIFFFCRFVHKHGYLANQFIIFFQVCFLRATKIVYRRQFFFLSLYHCIPPLPLLPPFTKIFWLPFQ